MKLDEDVKMISAEAPVLFSKAAELFIHELTLRAWIHTEENKRRTLQKNDVALAISKCDTFDFLIDIVPREDGKTKVVRKNIKFLPKIFTSYKFQFRTKVQLVLEMIFNITLLCPSNRLIKVY